MSVAPEAIGVRSRSRTSRSFGAHPSAQLVALSDGQRHRSKANGRILRNRVPFDAKRDVVVPRKTVESGVAEPRTTVQFWLGLWKDDWNNGVLAWATDAMSRQHVRRNMYHLS